MITKYVRNGGKLIIETGQKVPQSESLGLPQLFPIKATKLSIADRLWNLKVEKNILTGDVDLQIFTPLETKYLPYSISEARLELLRDWAKPVLLKDGQVFVAFGELEKGKVVWSGINLPFHAIDNRNTSETVIFSKILEWFFPEKEEEITNFSVGHPKPEKILVKIKEGKGVLLKENYNPGWLARVHGKKVKIFKAGLFQMYIPINVEEGEQLIDLTFYGAPVYWFLFIISSMFFLFLLSYLIFDKNPLAKLFKNLRFNTQTDEEDY